ncbi:MAG: electron transfer flavoprotein subunit alpha, partial [Lachnospiraceae bacterium]|nr:electron transfer flavoprotein subunit alpha [Lachnospiraceae bacterium]
MKSEVWVYTELGYDKSIKKVSRELLSAAARLAEKTEEELVAVIFGYEIEKESSEIARYADKVIMIDDRRFNYYGTERYTDAFTKLIRKYKPSTILIGATANGRDLAPRVACRMGTGLTADCTGLDIDEESGKVAWIRPAFGGKLMATILCPDRYPQIGT